MPSDVVLPIENVTGQVYDQSAGLLIAVTSDGNLYEWSSSSGQMVAEKHLAASLSGLALSSDGSSVLTGVALAAGNYTLPTSLQVLDVNVASLAQTSVTLPPNTYETGVAEIAVGADGNAYASTSFSGSGFEPIRVFSAASSGAIDPAQLNSSYFATPIALSTSENGRYILAAPQDISNGPLYVIDTTVGGITAHTDLYTIGSSGFNSGNEAISEDAHAVADALGGEVLVFDLNLQLQQTLKVSSGNQVAGVAFNDDGKQLLAWDSAAHTLLVYDTSTWGLIQTIALNGGSAPGQGTYLHSGGMTVSANGAFAFLDTSTGVEVVDLAVTTPIQLGQGEIATAANQTLYAASTGDYYFQPGGDGDTVVLTGNVGDYTLSRVQPAGVSGATDAQVGAFLLTATNGSGAYAIEEGVSTVQFQNGQYLSLKDLPAYVHGDASLETGGGGSDLLYQTPTLAYELFIGGGGTDSLYLNGNTSDYTLKSFTAETATDASGQGGQSYSGLELVATNGSGALLIDSSVETIHFQDGQYLAYGDLHAYVAANASPAADTLDIALDGDSSSSLTYQGGAGSDRALLDADASRYSLSRDAAGDFVLTTAATAGHAASTATISQAVETVQFADGQYLSLKDLGAYIGGSDVFTQGTAGDDLLFTPSSGDAYVVGGAGTDNLYLTGNTRDYTLQAVDLAATSSHAAIDGYELMSVNGSGNIYIDSSVETVHFQNGQYLAFHDLPAYVTAHG